MLRIRDRDASKVSSRREQRSVNAANRCAAPPWQKLGGIIAPIQTGQRQCYIMVIRLWRESHSPEVVQRLQRFDAGFEEFAVLLILYPRD
jgi:hypothetical protein